MIEYRLSYPNLQDDEGDSVEEQSEMVHARQLVIVSRKRRWKRSRREVEAFTCGPGVFTLAEVDPHLL